jgi:hypothetical protein
VYWTVITSDPGAASGGAVVYTLEPPPEFERSSDPLVTDGIFVQTIRYDTQNAKIPFRILPLIAARSIRIQEVVAKADTWKKHLFYPLVAGACGAALIILYFGWRVVRSHRRRFGLHNLPSAQRGNRNG